MNTPAGKGWFDRLLTPPEGATNWLWLSLLVIGADQLTKYYVVDNLDLFDRVELFFMLDLTLLHNTGAAFSFLSDAGGWQRWMFIALGLVVSLAIVFWLRGIPRRGQTWLAIALALIVGGALGNVIDRVLYGYVIDFISVHYLDWYFPAFNVADSAITVGAAMIIIDSLFLERRRQKLLGTSAQQEAGSGKREVRPSPAGASGHVPNSDDSGEEIAEPVPTRKAKSPARKKKSGPRKKASKKQPTARKKPSNRSET